MARLLTRSRCGSILGPMVCAYAASQSLSPARSETEADEPSPVMAIVDCGSGYTRVKLYERSAADGSVLQSSSGRVVRRTTASGRTMPPLHSLLASGGDVAGWVEALREVLEAEAKLGDQRGGTDRKINVLVGATAGVRSAIEAETVTEASLATAAAAIRAAGGLNGGSASFRLLSGDEEAAMELAAARHCLFGSSDEGKALVTRSEQPGRGGVGLLSSGGASSQLAFVEKDQATVRTMSLPTHVKKGNSLCLEKGVVAGLREYQAQLAALVDELREAECFVGKLKGTFVSIEMNASYAGRIAGINGRAMTAAEATVALEASLAARVAEVQAREEALKRAAKEGADSPPAGDLKPLTWSDMCYCTATAADLMMVRDLLHPTKATVIHNRVFDQKAGGSLQPSWSLGCYLLESQQPPPNAAALER